MYATPATDEAARVEAVDGGYLVQRCVRIPSHGVRTEHSLLSELAVERLLHCRIETIVRRAALSTRERQVFELILLGRSQAEIGCALGITVRTVRFHQSNILDKVGAEHRHDLMRLLS